MNHTISSANLTELATQCKRYFSQNGIDGRTHCLSQVFKNPQNTATFLAEVFAMQPTRALQFMQDILSDRYVDLEVRRNRQHKADINNTTFFLSQGYKRGLFWQDVPLGKTCYDINIYQQMIQQVKPKTIIEIGSGLGGSGLFLLDTAKTFGLDVKLITMDRNNRDISPKLTARENAQFIFGDAKDIENLMPDELLASLPHPWIIIEDCHHHVPVIVAHLHKHMDLGDYLVIEDLVSKEGKMEVDKAIGQLPPGSLLIDTHYNDMFGVNVTCSPDAIFCKLG